MKITKPRFLAVAALTTGLVILGAAQQGGIGPLWRKFSAAVASTGRAVQERLSGQKNGESVTAESDAASSGQVAEGQGLHPGDMAAGGSGVLRDGGGVTNKASAKKKESNPFTTPESMRERAAVLARIKDKDQLSAEFKLFVADLTVENWVQAFEDVYPLYGKGLLGPGTWEDLMAKIGNIAGAKAMEKFRPTDSLMNYEAYSARLAMQSWATKDLEAAKQYLLTLPDGRFKDGMGVGLFQAMVGRDRAGLEALFASMPEAYWPQIATTLRDVIRWEPGGTPVPNWLQQTEASLGKDSAQSRAVKQAAELHELEHAEFSKLPVRLAQLASDYFGNPTNVSDRVLSTSALALAGSQPGQAMDYVDGLGGRRPALTATVPGIVSAWTKADLGAPGEWLNGHAQSPLYDDTVAAYVKELKPENPAAALKWAETMHDPARKQAALQMINGQ